MSSRVAASPPPFTQPANTQQELYEYGVRGKSRYSSYWAALGFVETLFGDMVLKAAARARARRISAQFQIARDSIVSACRIVKNGVVPARPRQESNPR
jgi:hypothetical protein